MATKKPRRQSNDTIEAIEARVDTLEEVHAACYRASANGTTNTTTPINFDTKIYDDRNLVTVSPTAWRFTAQAAGIYTVLAHISFNTTGQVHVYKNGAIHLVIAFDPGAYQYTSGIDVQLGIGEFIDIRPNTGSVGYNGGALSAHISHISIHKVG